MVSHRNEAKGSKGKRRERNGKGNRRGMKKQKIVYYLQTFAKDFSKFPYRHVVMN